MKPTLRVSLNENWQLFDINKEYLYSINLPNSIFDTLVQNKTIEDPFFAHSETKFYWIYEKEWVYEKKLKISREHRKYKHKYLVFHGIDTIAEIYIDNYHLGSINNMFRIFKFDISPFLEQDFILIKVFISNPLTFVQNQIEKYGKISNFMDTIPGIAYIRKAQYAFGWDWGFKLPDIGIWKSVELLLIDNFNIDNVAISTKITFNNSTNLAKIRAEKATISVEFELTTLTGEIQEKKPEFLEIKLLHEDTKQYEKTICLKDESLCSANRYHLSFTINNPELWWPHSLGTSFLYDFHLILRTKEIVVDSYQQKLGIRQIDLIQHSDKWGKSFYFSVNQVPLFAKGANWIPIHQFIPRGQRMGLYTNLIKSAKNAHMNILRVWGGGIYETNEFYDLCDREGILVWQDFMFACSVYPIDTNFWNNVHEEVYDNVIRLRNHASLALWCGNNEIEYLFKYYILPFLKKLKFKQISKYKHAYIQFFEDTLPVILQQLDPSRFYWPSSPSNGGFSYPHGLKKSNRANTGDSHFWKVWHFNAPFTAYQQFYSRFMSEFGFEAFPNLQTIEKYYPSKNPITDVPITREIFSPIMEYHQRNKAGNKKLIKYASQRFILSHNFEKQVLLTQITQGEAIEFGVAHWRANRNQQRCMGSLYWQLNDCWPVASWSSIDYYGGWKALHYFARRFYQNLYPQIIIQPNSIQIVVTNDTRSPHRITLTLHYLFLDGEVKKSFVWNNTIQPCETQRIAEIPIQEFKIESTYRKTSLLFLEAISQSYPIIQPAPALFSTPKDLNLQNPKIRYEIVQIGSVDFVIEIKVEKPALFISIVSKILPIFPEDNFFMMIPDSPKQIRILINNRLRCPENLFEGIFVKKKHDLIKKYLIIWSLYELQREYHAIA